MRRSSQLGVLGELQFRRLFLGRAISELGSSFTLVALPFAVLSIHGTATDIGLVEAANLVPLLLLLAIGGVWADRLPRQKVMLAADVCRAGLQAATAVLLVGGMARVWNLVLLQVAVGACEAFFRPAGTGLVPQAASHGRLQQANALLNLARSVSVTLGAAFGGLLVAAIGAGWAIGLDGVTFLVSAAFLWRLRPHPVPTDGGEGAGEGFLAELAHGWREFVSHRWLWVMVAGASVFLFFNEGAINVLGPVVMNSDYQGARTWGFVMAAVGLGQIVAGALSLRWRPPRPLLLVAAGMAVAALPAALLALRAPAGLLLSGAAVMGFEWGLYDPLWHTVMQQRVAPDKLSRVSAWDLMGSIAMYPAGLAAAGPLAGLLGVNTILWLASGIAVAVALAQVAVREVRTVGWRDGAA